MTALENARLDAMEEKLETLQSDVKEILSALKGSELQLDKGLVIGHINLSERVTKLEGLKNKITWVSIGAGVAAGMSIDKVIEWIQIIGNR